MSVPLRVLVVEDSQDDADLLVRELRRGGFDVKFQRVDTSESMRIALDIGEWDVVVSDFSMPHFSGTAALTLLRKKHTDIPFIFASGTIGEETAVAALKSGAQDYVMKTNLKRLVPAIQRELNEVEQKKERRQLELQIQQLHKFEAIGRLAGGIAHDFNNVIGAILAWAEMGYDESSPGSRSQERFKNIRDQGVRAARLTSQLLAFARRQVLQRRKINVNEVVEDGMNLLHRVIGENIEIQVAPSANLRVTMADPAQIDQVLMNLCLNARDAMPKGGRLTIKTENVEVSEEFCRAHTYARAGSYILLTVSDTGTGMDSDTLERIFEPFFTTKELGRGAGLGLATVYGVVKQHGGIITVDSELGKGTTFRIYLPAEAGIAEAATSVPKETPRPGTETILLAEDHDGLREAAQEMLQSLGYHVIPAADGVEAVKLFVAHADEIDIALLDMVMPGLSGADVYAQMVELRPDIGVVFTTGYTSESELLSAIVKEGAPVVQKPYDHATLSAAIRKVLARDRSKHEIH